ncbi:MAG: DEAD/DEAH box helicase [Ilumatobacter sp.]|uniref:DEAD/DEAH box helicase n=1 Tax=Ilumatobacter sp. TaxID=1967498 RepID=UPI002637AB01|nr:DEAD/DEAH box helicase [Ilumatobacter sp.]MDJ0769240.1 DEAD/DEAH box helicase [Ilumatobacter sp.]
MTTPVTFAQLGVPQFICDALARRGITEPFAIQAATIADGLAGRDVCGRAPTGSGKTLAFGVPLVANTTRSEPRRPTSLVLAPTRELAEQITSELRSFSGRVRVDAVYGGVGYGAQLKALRRGVDILVACPGRLEDLLQRGDVDLADVVQVVLDEADRMADMGFLPAVRRLLDRTAPERQTVLFSATLDGDVAKLTREYQRDPVRHEVGEGTPDVRSADHRFWKVERLERNPVVAEVVKAAWPSIIFCRTRHGADRLAKQLGKLDLAAAPIHGGRSQSQRNRALDDFGKGRVHALVATDVAARGIHVDGVASVIHYDPPEDHKAYVHRSGRTARAGADGLVVSLVQPGQAKELRKMQRLIGLDVPFTDPDTTIMPEGALAGDRELAPPVVRRDEPTRPKRSGRRRIEGQRTGQGSSGAAAHRNRSSDGGRAGSGTPSSGGDRDGGRGRDDRTRRSGRGRSPQQGGPDRRVSKGGGSNTRGPNAERGGRPQAGNRKARRAHLQPGARPR